MLPLTIYRHRSLYFGLLEVVWASKYIQSLKLLNPGILPLYSSFLWLLYEILPLEIYSFLDNSQAKTC